MRSLRLDLQSFGGIARTPQLRALGHSRYELARAVRTGEVTRPRIGWLALSNADAGAGAGAVRAVQLGGRLASANSLTSHGLWVSQVVGLTVQCSPNAARLPPLRPGERRTFRALKFRLDATKPWRVSVADALIQFSFEVPPREWLASVDSALHTAQITTRQLLELSQWVPAGHRKVASLADGSAASGNETYVRMMLIGAGLRVETQVKIPLVGDVGVLVDGWLIVETDSREFHGAEADQVTDRIRDGNALLLGFGTVRFMPESLQDAPDWCLEVVLARLRQGRPRPQSGRAIGTPRVSS